LPQTLIDYYKKIGKEPPQPPFTMYRNKLTLKDICTQTNDNEPFWDENYETACEIHAECGIDN